MFKGFKIQFESIVFWIIYSINLTTIYLNKLLINVQAISSYLPRYENNKNVCMCMGSLGFKRLKDRF